MSNRPAPTVTVYLPCDVGHVRVRTNFGSTLSPMEDTVLRVISALTDGRDSDPAGIDDLAALLGLGRKVTLDLVHDLWRHGYLTVDFADGSISLSPEVRRRLADGSLRTLASAESDEHTVELMIERLTGHVMPSAGPRSPKHPRFAVNQVSSDVTLDTAPRSELLAAVSRWLRQQDGDTDDGELLTEIQSARGGAGRPRQISSVRTVPADLRVVSGRRWYAMDVQAEIDEDTDTLVVTVVDRHFPPTRRELASTRLTQLAQAFPNDPLTKQLREVASAGLAEPPPIEEDIARLTEDAARLERVPPTQRRARHLELADDARRIEAMLDHRFAREVEHRVVIGPTEHAAILAELVDSARTQIVIAVPWVRYAALRTVEPRLRQAVKRGVQVVVVWGIAHRSTLDVQVDSAIDSLTRERGRASALVPKVSARTHAKVVVCDDRRALVTSWNALSARGGDHEIGLLLSSPDDRGGEAVRDLLGWVRTTVPEGPLSRMVLQQEHQFPPPSTDPTAPRPTTPVPTPPPDESTDEQSAGAVRAWGLAWAEYAARFQQRLAERVRSSARIVEDGEHRELLWRALRMAARRLVISSHEIGDEVLDRRMADALERCLRRGVEVTVSYGRPTAQGSTAAALLRDLADRYPDLMRLNVGGTHAKVLVWDDDVVVGSFNYLSYAGHGTLGGRHLQRSELSVRLAGPAIANEVASAAGEPAEVTARVAGRSSGTVAPAPPAHDPGVLAATRRILDAAGDGATATSAIAAELTSTDDPWPVLESLHEVESGSMVVRAAAAFCLSRYAGDADPDVVLRWRRHLVVDLWRSGAFVEAAVLRCADNDGTWQPSPSFAVAAAARTTPRGGDALVAAVFDADLVDDERSALLAVAVAETLARGSSDAHGAVEVLSSSISGPWAKLGELAVDYHARTIGADTADLMHAIADERQRRHALRAAWESVDLALEQSRPLPVDIEGAKRTHAALFKESGIFGMLGDAATRRDVAGLRNLVGGTFPDANDPEERAGVLVDDTWRQVAPRHELLTGMYRGKYLGRLAKVVLSVRSLTRLATEDHRLRHRPELLDATRALADGFHAMRPELAGENGRLGRTGGPVAAAVLADLDHLFAGTKEEALRA
ncbi:hypothetical protein OG884_12260 [Streptosporangium sp. NBC_01755]|uniref:phospholipase D-like domain-containing protein n=1 Tax=Streptosporangium sp. NBC_01755 TaxID=2975949 RepID=UPI002DDC1B60|nr:phospholipase D-like domain-containing protein [Streptosporangium sp. NBC_01755]WSD02636.1 hypothetical protein OG884_12260 [Streptosporangium sp. NBC_01755]